MAHKDALKYVIEAMSLYYIVHVHELVQQLYIEQLYRLLVMVFTQCF